MIGFKESFVLALPPFPPTNPPLPRGQAPGGRSGGHTTRPVSKLESIISKHAHKLVDESALSRINAQY